MRTAAKVADVADKLIRLTRLLLAALAVFACVVGSIHLGKTWWIIGGSIFVVMKVIQYIEIIANDIMEGVVTLLHCWAFGIFKHLNNNNVEQSIKWLNEAGFKTRHLGNGWLMLWRPWEWHVERWRRLFRYREVEVAATKETENPLPSIPYNDDPCQGID